ncbi:unnamed protein product, partial [Aureobasidium mustum]
MGKGGMKRDNHHCPQSRRGGCRWINSPVHRCYTHTFVCPIHNLPHQTYQSCLSCDGARLAVERALRNSQSTAQDLTTLHHDSSALDNWFLTTCLTTRPQGAMAPKDGVFTTTFWFLAGLFVLLFWRIPS